MLFFGFEKIFNRIKDKRSSLQVISPPVDTNDFSRKRVWLSAFFRFLKEEVKKTEKYMWRKRQCGSMTVEAAMGLSLFLFMAVLLLIPMRIMNTERRMQGALEAAGEEMAQYAYIGNSKITGILYGTEQIREMTDTKAVRNISLRKSSILEDGYTIDLIVDYEVCLPFPIFRIDGLKRQLRCCRRAWVGKKGGKGKGENPEETEEIVYIGKGSTRYHKNRTCHYLFNDISQVDFSEIKTLRNRDGKKYNPCKICGKGIRGGSVYIMPSGDCYHSTGSCRAITAYVQAVPLSSVKNLGPCSYCSGE